MDDFKVKDVLNWLQSEILKDLQIFLGFTDAGVFNPAPACRFQLQTQSNTHEPANQCVLGYGSSPVALTF